MTDASLEMTDASLEMTDALLEMTDASLEMTFPNHYLYRTAVIINMKGD